MEKIKLSFPPPSSIIWRNKVFCFPQGEPHFHDLSRQQMTTSVRYERWLHSERRIKSADLGYVGIAPGFKCVRGYGTLKKKKKMVRPHSGMRQRSISTCRGLPTRNWKERRHETGGSMKFHQPSLFFPNPEKNNYINEAPIEKNLHLRIKDTLRNYSNNPQKVLHFQARHRGFIYKPKARLSF